MSLFCLSREISLQLGIVVSAWCDGHDGHHTTQTPTMIVEVVSFLLQDFRDRWEPRCLTRGVCGGVCVFGVVLFFVAMGEGAGLGSLLLGGYV